MSVNARQASSPLTIRGQGPNTDEISEKFVRPDQLAMFARVTAYPPLGQVTNIRRSEEDNAVSTFNSHRGSSTNKLDQKAEHMLMLPVVVFRGDNRI
jgi:hypothetical protein